MVLQKARLSTSYRQIRPGYRQKGGGIPCIFPINRDSPGDWFVADSLRRQISGCNIGVFYAPSEYPQNPGTIRYLAPRVHRCVVRRDARVPRHSAVAPEYLSWPVFWYHFAPVRMQVSGVWVAFPVPVGRRTNAAPSKREVGLV